MALTIAKRVVAAPSTHRFTRWVPQAALYTISNTGANPSISVVYDSTSSTAPISVSGGSSLMQVNHAYQFGGSMRFRLGDLPGLSDFTNLFDYYRIEQVDVEISCLKNSAAGTSQPSGYQNGDNVMPTIMYAPDFDDDVIPVGASDLTERQKTKSWTFRGDGKPLKFSIQPRPTALVYKEDGTTIGYMTGTAGNWVDCNNVSVPHYGVKFWLEDVWANTNTTGTTADTQFKIKMKYHVSCKDPR